MQAEIVSLRTFGAPCIDSLIFRSRHETVTPAFVRAVETERLQDEFCGTPRALFRRGNPRPAFPKPNEETAHQKLAKILLTAFSQNFSKV